MTDEAGWRRQIAELAHLDSGRMVFGATSHNYQLNRPLSAEDAVALERRYRFDIPPDYRNFLLLDGSGGAGPGYGLWPLGLWDPTDQKLETWDAGSWTDHPSQPFPHTSAWNLPQELMAASPSAEASWEELGAYLPLVEAATWAPGVADGAIPIANLGCAIRLLLIVNGPERGHIWIDDRASDGGIYPATTEEHPSRMTFDEVFGDWLEQGRRTATTSHRTPRPW